MSAPEDNTRPVSVAELLARNERIGSPPVGGRRRRRRRSSDGLSVAELTGEIPVVRAEELAEGAARDEEAVLEEITYQEAGYEEAGYGESYQEADYQEVADEEATYQEVAYEQAGYGEVTYQEAAYEEVTYEEAGYGEVTYQEAVYDDTASGEVTVVHPVTRADTAAPPRANDPRPRRSAGPELSHDPRPRSSEAERMAYDPVDESVNLADLVDEPAGDVEELRSYLKASSDTLFSGGTVADDLARRGVATEPDGQADEYYEDTAASADLRPRGLAGTLLGSAVAVLQSLVAVAFGAGLFIGFDQLWRWNSLVALILSVLVVLTLAAAVRYVRKTEDIVSTLTAVAVGLLVTLGPLALQST